MYLKSLVLKGFKSFADRSALSLEPGITAIVGPNGSGKSNISDAVLWVLGERNAKHLRGQAMEDVIFAGSSARKATGLAEVDLVLDNTDGTLPVDFSEVAITRRMYRSGESEYLINGTLARRMDVLDILHDSGLGTGTHSIISQGSLDSILQSKPEDRRALIEEAAGVLKHKQRKAKSERKLEQMDHHLARARDVVAEVERQLGPLERKAKRALAYQGLSSELAELTLQLAVDDLRALQRKWDDTCAREQAFSAELDERRTSIAQAEARVGELQEKIRLESVDAGELARRHRLAAAAADRIDSAVLVMRERRRSAQDRADELEASLEANKVKRIQAQTDLAHARSQLEEVRLAREQADTQVTRLVQEAEGLSARRSELERETVELGRASRQAEAELSTARREQTATQEALSNGLAHVKLIEGHGKELSLQMESAQRDAEKLADAQASGEVELKELEERDSSARAHMVEALAARDEARAVRDAARDAERDVMGKIKGIEEVERASAAASGPALAWLLEHAGDVAAGLEPLSHAVSASRGNEALVEHLLGADVAALLVADADAARRVSAALGESGQTGTVSLVMRKDVCEGAVAGAAQRAADEGRLPHGCAPLAGQLSFSSADSRAVVALLGDVAVCETLEEALAAHAHDAFGLRFATPEGAVVWPSGKVTLGAAASVDEEGALVRARRLEEARAHHAQACAACEEAACAAAAAEETLRAAQAESMTASRQLAQKRGRIEAARIETARAQEKLAAMRRELEGVEGQRAAAQAAIAEARPNVDALAQKVDKLAKQFSEAKEKLACAQDAVAPLREAAARSSEELSEAKLAFATLSERETYTARVCDARQREIEQLQAADTSARAALGRKRASVARMAPLLAVFDELSESARRWTRVLEEAAFAAQDASSGLHASANEARTQVRQAQELFDGASERLSAVRVDKGRLEVQVEAAVNAIVHDCATPLESALKLPELKDRADVEGRAFKLRRRIANMGAINPDAASEYEALKARYDYLAGQLSDLDSARRSLAKINRVIDARMKDDFVRTYEAVDKNFQEIFAVLFPGGSAHLSLVDPSDLENTGVEVSAQPRGKRITKMMLMSGGEKSLTALALLFAVYRIRATPFYILDEVEAALDDTNLRRLLAYVQTLRERTQLIMITHQRRTMEAADVLFGVSMQADGVTKVISQKLDRALEYAEG